MNFKLSVLSAIFVAGVVACSDNNHQPVAGTDTAAVVSNNTQAKTCLTAPTNSSWQDGISAIFQTNCGSCHPGSRPTDYTSFGGVTGNITTELSYIDGNTMPPSSPLSASDKSAIHAWVTSGMPQSTSTVASSSTSNSTGCSTTSAPVPTQPATTTSTSPIAAPAPATAPAAPSSTVLSWQGGIATIFQTNCGSCHPGSRPTDYSTYAGVVANISAEQMRITAGTMPPAGALSQANQSLINAWVAAGMPETDAQIPTTPTPTPPPAPALIPTYSKGVATIMAASCTGCHSQAGGTSPYLDTLARVQSNFSNVYSTINSGSMPRGGTKLPASQIQLIKQWGTAPNAPYGQWAP